MVVKFRIVDVSPKYAEVDPDTWIPLTVTVVNDGDEQGYAEILVELVTSPGFYVSEGKWLKPGERWGYTFLVNSGTSPGTFTRSIMVKEYYSGVVHDSTTYTVVVRVAAPPPPPPTPPKVTSVTVSGPTSCEVGRSYSYQVTAFLDRAPQLGESYRVALALEVNGKVVNVGYVTTYVGSQVYVWSFTYTFTSPGTYTVRGGGRVIESQADYVWSSPVAVSVSVPPAPTVKSVTLSAPPTAVVNQVIEIRATVILSSEPTSTQATTYAIEEVLEINGVIVERQSSRLVAGFATYNFVHRRSFSSPGKYVLRAGARIVSVAGYVPLGQAEYVWSNPITVEVPEVVTPPTAPHKVPAVAYVLMAAGAAGLVLSPSLERYIPVERLLTRR